MTVDFITKQIVDKITTYMFDEDYIYNKAKPYLRADIGNGYFDRMIKNEVNEILLITSKQYDDELQIEFEFNTSGGVN